jgi:hypothetical protein
VGYRGHSSAYRAINRGLEHIHAHADTSAEMLRTLENVHYDRVLRTIDTLVQGYLAAIHRTP